MREDLQATTVSIEGHGGDRVEAYFARPLDDQRAGGVVVIHHMPGYDEATREITRRFAAHGYLAVCPNLYTREAPGASSDDAAAAVRARGGLPDEQVVGDVGGALSFLRSQPQSNGKVATIGYCSGGRHSFLAACSLPLDAAVDCYGAWVVRNPPEGTPFTMRPLVDRVPQLSCPVLGLFGVEDQFPSPDEVAELDAILTGAGKDHEFHSYEGAGHAFFATDRPSYRPEAANQGWAAIWRFFERHLAG